MHSIREARSCVVRARRVFENSGSCRRYRGQDAREAISVRHRCLAKTHWIGLVQFRQNFERSGIFPIADVYRCSPGTNFLVPQGSCLTFGITSLILLVFFLSNRLTARLSKFSALSLSLDYPNERS